MKVPNRNVRNSNDLTLFIYKSIAKYIRDYFHNGSHWFFVIIHIVIAKFQ